LTVTDKQTIRKKTRYK